MEGEQTDYVWGVLDMIPDTDFPDIRNKTIVHSQNGSCMIIPREGDLVRIYIQLEGKDAVDAKSGRVDKNRVGPEMIFEVARKSFQPYTFRMPNSFEWWTIYISELSHLFDALYFIRIYSRPAGRGQVLCSREGIHCRRCMPYAFPESWPGYECQYE